MKPEKVTIIEAPSILGLRPTGVEAAPPTLLSAGLRDRIRARHAGRIDPQPYDPQRDPQTGILNSPQIAEYTPRLAHAIGEVVRAGEFPLVLGGDCSILLGSMLALRRQGRYGLLFLDGHMDFYQPQANINGESASSELAFVTGRGPAPLTTFEAFHPLVRDQDVVAFGFRDEEEAQLYGSQPLPPEMHAIRLEEIRGKGVETAAREAVAHVADHSLDGFWIHFDVDVLDDEIMPAVDYRMAGGLTWNEAELVLKTALSSGKAAGLEVTIFNPALDDTGAAARGLVEMIARVFTF